MAGSFGTQMAGRRITLVTESAARVKRLAGCGRRERDGKLGYAVSWQFSHPAVPVKTQQLIYLAEVVCGEARQEVAVEYSAMGMRAETGAARRDAHARSGSGDDSLRSSSKDGDGSAGAERRRTSTHSRRGVSVDSSDGGSGGASDGDCGSRPRMSGRETRTAVRRRKRKRCGATRGPPAVPVDDSGSSACAGGTTSYGAGGGSRWV